MKPTLGVAMHSRFSARVSAPDRSLGIRHWLLAVLFLGMGLMLYRNLNPKEFYGVVCVFHGLTPIWCWFSIAAFRSSPWPTRFGLGLLLTTVSVSVMVAMTYQLYGVESLVWVPVAMLVEWPGQLPFVFVLFLILRQPQSLPPDSFGVVNGPVLAEQSSRSPTGMTDQP